jgi:hypothetical protein
MLAAGIRCMDVGPPRCSWDHAYRDGLRCLGCITLEARAVAGVLGNPCPDPPIVRTRGQLIGKRQRVRLSIGRIGGERPFDDAAKAGRCVGSQVPQLTSLTGSDLSSHLSWVLPVINGILPSHQVEDCYSKGVDV